MCFLLAPNLAESHWVAAKQAHRSQGGFNCLALILALLRQSGRRDGFRQQRQRLVHPEASNPLIAGEGKRFLQRLSVAKNSSCERFTSCKAGV
jgi:hypothetical protein